MTSESCPACLEFGRDGAAILRVKAMPGLPRAGVQGIRGDCLVVKLHATAEKGKANEELIHILSDFLDCPKSSLTILSGHLARHKRISLPASALPKILGL